MRLGILNIDKLIQNYNIKEVYNHNIQGAGSLFDPNIFGQGEQKKTKLGYINLYGNFIDPTTYKYISGRVFRDLPGIVAGTKKVSIDPKTKKLVADPNGHTGLKWLYDNWGKFIIKDKKEEINKYTREDFFTNKWIVMPQHYRDIDTSGKQMKIDELNQYYIDLIRNARFKAQQKDNPSMDTSFIDMKIQGILQNIIEHLSKLTFFKNGVQREKVMGRSVDNGSLITISAPEVRMKDTIGNSKIKLGYTAVPLHHIINMMPVHIISGVQNFLNYFYDLGLMKIDREEFEYHFSDEYIKERMKAFFYSYADRSYYVEGPNKEKFEFDFEFHPDKGSVKKMHRGITWLELFYLAAMSVKDNVRIQQTRFPTTNKGSIVLGKVNILTCNIDGGDLKIKKGNDVLYTLDDFVDITHYIDDPIPQIYEETQKINNLYLDALDGDYDGDKMTDRLVYSKEAVDEIDNFLSSPLAHLSMDGHNIRPLKKEGIQCIYDLTRDGRPNEVKKEDPKFNTELSEFFTPKKNFKLQDIVGLLIEHSPYQIVKWKGKRTTLGRVIVNEVIFNHIEDHKFIDKPLNSKEYGKVTDMYAAKLVAKEISNEDFLGILNKGHDVAFGLCEIVGSSMNYDFMVKDDPALNKKKAELLKKYKLDKDDTEADPIAVAGFESEMIAWCKEHYKENEAASLYNSGAKPKWDVDFKMLKVSMGTTPIPGESKSDKVIIKSLKEGLSHKDVQQAANLQIVGAAARGVDTQKGGYLVKKFNYLLQSVFVSEGDCGSTEYKTVTSERQDLLGRYVLDKGKLVHIDSHNVEKYENRPVQIRSPFFCRQKHGYCSTCVGTLPLELSGKKKVPIGLYVQEVGSSIMGKSMKATHDMRQRLFTISDLDDYIEESK